MDTNILFSRRLFLNRGVQLLSAAATLPVFLDRSAHCMAADFAANPSGVGRPDDKILVILQLAGGNDGLNTVVPFRNDDYHRARPTLKVAPAGALKLNDEWALPPSATGLKKLWDAGELGIVHAVGYPNPNRSHFRSTDIWTTGEPDRVGTTGWLGRYCDACCDGKGMRTESSGLSNKKNGGSTSSSTPHSTQSSTPSPQSSPDPATAIALEQEPPAALTGKTYIPLTFRAPQSMTYRGGRAGAFEKLNAGEVMPDPTMDPKMSGAAHGPQTEGFLERSALNARVYAERIRGIESGIANKAIYPTTPLGQDLKLVAQMIASDLPTRIYYVKLGGFDTHADQIRRHPLLMEELSGSLAAFVQDLKLMGHLNRTTVMTFSEFGRRVHENGSGTDHGEAAPLFLAGGAIKAGFHGHFPSLAPQSLNRGDVPFTTDFRKVYATLLKQWLGADDTKILGGKFEPLDIYKM